MTCFVHLIMSVLALVDQTFHKQPSVERAALAQSALEAASKASPPSKLATN